MFKAFLYLSSILFLLNYSKAEAAEERFGMNEHPGDKIPLDLELISEDSVVVQLRELISKPTLLSFVYYRCPGLCSPMMDGLAEAIDYTESDLGTEYQVITISIDYNETPELAKKKKGNYMLQMKNAAALDHWQFFTADSVTIRQLTKACGWEFKRQGNDFVHPAATIMISPKGMISQYFYGTYFNYMHLQMAIESAWAEEVNPVRLKNMKYCYNYDPPKNIAIELVTKTFGMLVILTALSIFIWLVLVPIIRVRLNHRNK